jgi:hypothetical protein
LSSTSTAKRRARISRNAAACAETVVGGSAYLDSVRMTWVLAMLREGTWGEGRKTGDAVPNHVARSMFCSPPQARLTEPIDMKKPKVAADDIMY